MMTLPQFRVRYSEFGTADDSLVQAMLDDAAVRLNNGAAFGAKADIAIGLMAAHLLLNKPYGRSQRLESGAEDDRYKTELDRLTVECIPSILVL